MRQRIYHDQTLTPAQQAKTVVCSPDWRRDSNARQIPYVTGLKCLLGHHQATLFTDAFAFRKPDVNVKVVLASYVGFIDPRRGEPAQDAVRGDHQSCRREPVLASVFEIGVGPHSAKD